MCDNKIASKNDHRDSSAHQRTLSGESDKKANDTLSPTVDPGQGQKGTSFSAFTLKFYAFEGDKQRKGGKE